jgi:DNA-binding NtrC family response regulator
MDNVNGYFAVNLKVVPMPDELWVLLVYYEEDPVRGMERILLDQEISTRRVCNCSEAKAVLRGSAAPVLILTDTSLPDGTWADVLEAASTAPTTAPVIVVSRLADIELYLDVLESGAYDFVVPPLSSADLAHIVGGALLKGRSATSARPNGTGSHHRLGSRGLIGIG